jgi:RNA polymerase sigma-70 factor, ECF subfamily
MTTCVQKSERLYLLPRSTSKEADCRDRAVVAELYKRTGKAALSKIMHVVGRKDVAEEILQDVFLRLWKAGITFPDERAAYSWIYKACHNSGIDYLRSAYNRRSVSPSEGFFDRLEDAKDLGSQTANRQIVTRYLNRLSDREAYILGYRVLDGMSQLEVAELLGIARKTVSRTEAKIADKISLAKKEWEKSNENF